MNDQINEEELQVEQNFAFKGIWIPVEASANPNLTPTDQKLFGLIKSFTDSSGQPVWASNDYFSKLLGSWEKPVTKQLISNSLRKLEQFEYISIVRQWDKQTERQIRMITVNQDIKKIYQKRIIKFIQAYNKNYKARIRKIIPNINSSILIEDSNVTSKEVTNNARTNRASSRGDRRDNNNSTSSTLSTPKRDTKNSLLVRGCHEPIQIKTSPYVEYWNTLSNVTHHAYFNNKDQLSKTYSTAHKLCTQLNRGMFGNNSINKTFLLKHKIDKTILTKKFTIGEIKKVLSNLSLMFAPGHWAGNGNGLKPNLPKLLYDPLNESSMFLAMYVKPDMADKTLEYKKPKDNYPHLTRRIIPLLDKKPDSNKHLHLLFKGIESIVEYHKTIKINRGGIGLSNVNNWFGYYVDFLESCCDNIEIRSEAIKVGNRLWNKFLTEYEEEWYVDSGKRQSEDYSGDIAYD
jgi:hypothetical protein